MSEKMLACPFKQCDGEIVLRSKEYSHYVECVGCGARGPIFTRPEVAIEWWNTRHDGAEGERLVEAAKRAIGAVCDCDEMEDKETGAHPSESRLGNKDRFGNPIWGEPCDLCKLHAATVAYESPATGEANR